MGADKSGLAFQGRRAVEMIAQALRPLTGTVRLVGSRMTANSQLPNIPDLIGEWGPLAGIQAALEAGESEWCIMVACDLPFVTCELFTRLFAFAGEADAIVPVQNDGHPQPLCALYRRAPCSVAAERAIRNGEHSPRALLDQVSACYVQFAEISDLENSEYFFFNVNTPTDLKRAEKIAGLLS